MADNNNNNNKNSKQSEEPEVDSIFIMEEILDNLKLLDYETHFLKKKINKPLSRTYFAIKSTNPGDQFIYFSSLSFWLLNLCGSNVQSDVKYEDPNTASQTILMEMKNLGLDSNVPPNKLRHGYGEFVCIVLQRLVNKALERKTPNFRKVKEEKTKDNEDDNNIVDIEEDLPDMINKEIDYGDNNLNKVGTNNNMNKEEVIGEEEDEEESKILISEIPKNAWMREVDRVSSKLKLDYNTISSYNNAEWRAHVEQIKTNDVSLAKSIPTSRGVLETLSEEISKTMEKIHKKESMISKNFTKIISDYKGRDHEKKSQLEEFNELRDKVDKMQKNFEEKEERLNELNEKWEEMNKKIDPSKINTIKTTITKLSQEVISYDTKISIVNYSLLAYRAKGITNINTSTLVEAAQDNNLFDEIQ